MAVLEWDPVGERFYETGVDRGVLYIPNASGVYENGVAWNGLISVSETPTGAEASAQYADNIKYLNLYSVEEFGATLEAFTYPDEFAPFDGLGVPTEGITVGQQSRNQFGLSYRTRVGNDLQGDDYGYKLHLIYGATASPSEKGYTKVNDSPEAITFSWEIMTVPVSVPNFRPSSLLTIDSSKVDAGQLTTLENFLYGTGGANPSLPLPAAVIALFSGTATEVTPVVPTNIGNNVTITETTGILWYRNGTPITLDGDGSTGYTITEDTIISAAPGTGYYFPAFVDDDWLFTFI